MDIIHKLIVLLIVYIQSYQDVKNLHGHATSDINNIVLKNIHLKPA